jgi:hypothetical protein
MEAYEQFTEVDENWCTVLSTDRYRVNQFGGDAGFYDIFVGGGITDDPDFSFIEACCRHAIAVECELLTHGYASYGFASHNVEQFGPVHDFHAWHDNILYRMRYGSWPDSIEAQLDNYNMSFVDMCARIGHQAAKRVGKALSVLA